jgi:spore germination cell wall hydrolase CwlJ-like protein
MRLPFRAAGLTAAAVASAAALFLAAPTQALDSPTAPVASPLLFHAAASVDGADLSVNPVAPDQTQPIEEPVQVVEHAVQTTDSESAEPDRAKPLAELVGDYATSSTDGSEHECLASAVYFEAKGEPLQGQLSVAQVVLNRTRSGRFPASVCGVVKQRGQFSFVRGGRLPAVRRDSAAWRKAVAVADIARQELAEGSAPNALFFHARRVSPGWSRATRVAAIGNHIFYR